MLGSHVNPTNLVSILWNARPFALMEVNGNVARQSDNDPVMSGVDQPSQTATSTRAKDSICRIDIWWAPAISSGLKRLASNTILAWMVVAITM